MKKILCIADAPGPAEFLFPVVPLIRGKAEVAVLAYGRAVEVLAKVGGREVKTESEAIQVFADFNPDILVVSISSLPQGPYINNKLIAKAHENNLPVICLQDILGNHRWPHNFSVMPFYSAVCTLDEFAGGLWKNDGYAGKIFATGNPAFDRFLSVDVKAERKHLRSVLGVSESDRVVLYAGQGVPRGLEEDKKTFKLLTSALRQDGMRDVKLIVRPHPRAEDVSHYREFSEGLNLVNTDAVHFSEVILPGADVIVSIFATNLIHACYMRLPAVSVMLPDGGGEILQALRLHDFPPNESGATIGIYEDNPKKFAEVLQKIFDDENYREAIKRSQESRFNLDGKSAERVAEVILAS